MHPYARMPPRSSLRHWICGLPIRCLVKLVIRLPLGGVTPAADCDFEPTLLPRTPRRNPNEQCRAAPSKTGSTIEQPVARRVPDHMRKRNTFEGRWDCTARADLPASTSCYSRACPKTSHLSHGHSPIRRGGESRKFALAFLFFSIFRFQNGTADFRARSRPTVNLKVGKPAREEAPLHTSPGRAPCVLRGSSVVSCFAEFLHHGCARPHPHAFPERPKERAR
jgi:hypothetical protein